MAIGDREALLDIEQWEEIASSELRSSLMSPGTVYWCRGRGRPLKLLTPGQIIDPEYFTKFSAQEIFRIERLCDVVAIEEVQNYFTSLKEATNEEGRIVQVKLILNWFADRYWFGKYNCQLLDLALVGTKVFYQLDRPNTNHLMNLDVVMLQKSALMAACSIFYALGAGYTDFNLLQDFYHLIILRDFIFTEQRISFTQKDLLESIREQKENLASGTTLLDDDKTVIFEHPVKTTELVAQKFPSIFYYPELIRMIRVHHETLNGEGWPDQVNDDELSDMERIMIFVEELFSYEQMVFTKNDGNAFFDRYHKMKIMENKSTSSRLAKIMDETIGRLLFAELEKQ